MGVLVIWPRVLISFINLFYCQTPPNICLVEPAVAYAQTPHCLYFALEVESPTFPFLA